MSSDRMKQRKKQIVREYAVAAVILFAQLAIYVILIDLAVHILDRIF